MFAVDSTPRMFVSPAASSTRRPRRSPDQAWRLQTALAGQVTWETSGRVFGFALPAGMLGVVMTQRTSILQRALIQLATRSSNLLSRARAAGERIKETYDRLRPDHGPLFVAATEALGFSVWGLLPR